MGEKCHACGGVGHYARECPTQKGKGKAKGGTGKGLFAGKGFDAYTKGAPKGGGGGKGGKAEGGGKGAAPQYGSCWTCGGAHFSRNCPNGKGSGKGGANAMQMQHHLCSVVHTQNRFQALEEEAGREDAAEGEQGMEAGTGGGPVADLRQHPPAPSRTGSCG